MSFVLLDIGGTFIKCKISDELTETKIDFPKFISTEVERIKEINPLELINAIQHLLKKIIKDDKKIDGIVVSGQMHGWVFTDESYEAKANLVSWQDLRSLENNFYESFINRVNKSDLINCGNEIKIGSPIVGLATNKNNPANSKLQVVSLLSWVTAQLVEKYDNTAHITDAAAFSCYDLVVNNWNQNVCNMAGISITSLPKVKCKISIIGFSKIRKIPVYTPVGDYQASLLGAGLTDGEISLNIATGGQVSYLGEGLAQPNMQTRPFFNGEFIHTKTHLPAGRHANYILEKFRTGNLEENWKYLNTIERNSIKISLDNCVFDLDIEKIFRNDELENFESLDELIYYIASILKCYTDIVNRAPNHLKNNVIGSGGLITNSPFVKNCLELLGNFKFKRIVRGEDASLKGLEMLVKTL